MSKSKITVLTKASIPWGLLMAGNLRVVKLISTFFSMPPRAARPPEAYMNWALPKTRLRVQGTLKNPNASRFAPALNLNGLATFIEHGFIPYDLLSTLPTKTYGPWDEHND